ncbi:MAG: hypothetical protein IJX81_01040 [Clostridia bacterium]|nr:hypothetical protein [Clostridia bacterium]
MKIIPSFDNIEKGYCVFDKRGKYKGLDENDIPQFSKPLSLEVMIAHGVFKKHLTIEILLDRKRERRAFCFGYENKRYSYTFEYSQAGYDEMLKKIERVLRDDLRHITELLDDISAPQLYAKYCHENNGRESDKERNKRYLILGNMYKVENVEMGQSSTSISLRGIKGSFNSVSFNFFVMIDGEYKEHDIYKDKKYNPYLRG